jgi:nitrous oxidase accessory protein NosD
MIFRTGAVMALFTGLAVVPAAAADTGVHCGDTITTNITLTRDLNCTGDGLRIADPRNVRASLTLNLAGHSIKGNGTGAGVVAGSYYLTVTNGTITGFAQGVDNRSALVNLARMKISRTNTWLSTHYGYRATVVDSRFVDAGPGSAYGSSPLRVTNSQFIRSSIVSGSQSNTSVFNSQFTDGNITAAWLWAGGNVINSCQAGAVAGFDIGKYRAGVADVSGNTIRGCAVGINLTSPDSDSTIEGNLLSSNGIGLQYQATNTLRTLQINGNVLTKNAGDGVLGTGDGAVIITANSASNNGELGINVGGAHVTDGGANTATDNGTTPACIGVVCQ